METVSFEMVFLENWKKKIIKAFPGTDLWIESKLKQWRKQYNCLFTMLRTSGFGWNDTKKMIQVDSDNMWDTYVRGDPEAKNMRNKPFSYYDDWCILFGKDMATGDMAEGPAEAFAAIEKEEQAEGGGYQLPLEAPAGLVNMDFSMGHSSNKGDSSTGTKKRGREKERISKGLSVMVAAFGSFFDNTNMRMGEIERISKSLSEMVAAFGSFFNDTNVRMGEIAHRNGYAHDLSEARKMVNGELRKLLIDSNQRLRAALLIVNDAQDLFFSLPEEDCMEWICLLLGGYI